MHRKFSFFSFFFILIACSLLIVTSAHSASIKERMSGRISAINTLKDQGSIGENNKGFLEYRSGKKPQKQLIADENKDRSTVYTAIAKKQGASPTLVGQRRAGMIAKKGKAGHWFQKPDGNWYKK